MTTAPLFTPPDLANWLDVTVAPARAAVVERVVWGWLQPILNVTERPSGEDRDRVFSWALELGGIAHENPANLASYQLGEERSQYSLERRNAILAEVAAGGVVDPGAGSGVATPLGSFPPPRRDPFNYDDPTYWP